MAMDSSLYAGSSDAEMLKTFEAVDIDLGVARWRLSFAPTGEVVACRWSSQFRKMLGYSGVEDFPDELSSWTNLIHPEDKQAVLDSYWAAVNDRSNQTVYNVKYRLLTKANGYRWYQDCGRLIRYEDGSAREFCGLFSDINERILSDQNYRKQIQESKALNKLLQEYNRTMGMTGHGMWHIILKDGAAPRMQANEKMAELLGVTGQHLTEEEMYSAWYARILPEAIPSVQASVGEMLAGHFSENTYRWSHPAKGVLYVRCGGIAVKQEDGSTVLWGYHSDVTDIVSREKEQYQRIEKARTVAEASQKKLAEAYGMIEGLSREYHTIWIVSKETSRMRLVRSSGVSTIADAVKMGKDYPEFDAGFEKYINTYVEPCDRERMLREIAFAEVLRQLEKGGTYAVNYLRRDPSGKVGYHQIAFANADTADGTKQFVYGFRDIDKIFREEQRQKEELRNANEQLRKSSQEQERQLRIVNALARDYANVFIIDMQSGKSKAILLPKATGTRIGVIGHEEHSYQEAIDKYIASGRLHPDDVETVRENFRFERVAAELADKLDFTGNFRILEEGKVHFYQFKYRKVKGTNYVILGFQNTDDVVAGELRKNEELARAKQEAEAANAAKTSFLFNMSHDIRTPMNAIMGYRDLLEKHQEDPVRRADYLRKIESASMILLSIINNVLEMARIEKGTVEIDESAWSAEQFNDTLYSVFRELMHKKGLTFTRQILVQNHYVFCDPTKLREIFLNILSNAYKYTDAGGKVNMHLEEIPSDREGWAMYQTTISDTGRGMSEEFLPHLYEEFSREQSTTDSKVEGTGLGMPIVKRLIDLLDGTIEVKSKKGVGTTFVVTLPHRITDKAHLVDHAGIVLDPTLFKGKRILLTEDNELNAEIATILLEEAGFQIERACDGKECVDMLKAAKPGYYDLILMDVQMPIMNGYEATRAIRRMEDVEKAEIPILAMTANAFEEDKREAMRAGMNGHIAKPVSVKLLMKELARVLY